MVIVAGHITVEPQPRESYFAGCVSVVERARGAAGCLDFAITADPIDPGRVNIFERRESQAALERNSQDLWIGVTRFSFRRRVAAHADLRHRLGHGQVLGPHPGRPDSRSSTAISFAVVSSLYPHTRSTALEESSP
jgi:hypothetical protein